MLNKYIVLYCILYIAKLNISENIFVIRGNIIDITLGIISHAISIKF